MGSSPLHGFIEQDWQEIYFGLTAPATVMVRRRALPDGGRAEAEGGVVVPPPDVPPPPQCPVGEAITAAGAGSPKKRDDPGGRLAVEPPPIATRFAPEVIPLVIVGKPRAARTRGRSPRIHRLYAEFA
jgi:hypothetical protein